LFISAVNAVTQSSNGVHLRRHLRAWLLRDPDSGSSLCVTRTSQARIISRLRGRSRGRAGGQARISGELLIWRDGTTVAPSPFMDIDRSAVPEPWTLAGFALEAGCEDGVELESVEPGVVVIVRTARSEYRLLVVNKTRRIVLVEGGTRFPEAAIAVLQGSTAGGNLLKVGWIGVGLRMELGVGTRRIITSPVRSVTFES
jgi:hypothetical protein